MVGKINISGLIGTIGDEKGVELIDVITQVKKQPNATSFDVFIQTEGGVVDTGFDIYNFLKSLGLPVTTIADKMVASIGTVIFMAGTKRIVKPNTKFMIHLPMGGIEYATADEMEAHSKSVRMTENNIINFYAKELGLNKEAISPLLRNETWLNSQQLIDLGFVTQLTDIKIAARLNKKISNKPKINTMTKTSKLALVLAKLLGKNVNKIIFSADNKELNFPDLTEDELIEVGARATFEGVPAEGEITTADGIVYVFEGGTLMEIKDVEAEEEESIAEDEMFDALIATLEVAAEMDERVSALETESVAIKKERDEFKTKLDNALSTIGKLKGGSPNPEIIVKDKDDKKDVNSITAQWKANKFKKKINK